MGSARGSYFDIVMIAFIVPNNTSILSAFKLWQAPLILFNELIVTILPAQWIVLSSLFNVYYLCHWENRIFKLLSLLKYASAFPRWGSQSIKITIGQSKATFSKLCCIMVMKNLWVASRSPDIFRASTSRFIVCVPQYQLFKKKVILYWTSKHKQ